MEVTQNSNTISQSQVLDDNTIITNNDEQNDNISDNDSKINTLITSKDCEWSVDHERILVEWGIKPCVIDGFIQNLILYMQV